MSQEEQVCVKYRQLLCDLKTTVEGLLNSQVANVWYIYGGLNRLHVDVEKIFKHGCKISGVKNGSDYLQFIQGLEWLQPDTSKSTFSLDCEYKLHFPQAIKLNQASIWLYKSLENHSLSQKLSWLLSDKSHLLDCYQTQAFLCQENYAEATLICLRAVERNQPSLISEIQPALFINDVDKDLHTHRRCSSFPESHIKSTKERKKSFDLNLKECDEKPQKKVVTGKLRAWNSTPNLRVKTKLKMFENSRTTPTTPKNIRIEISNKKMIDDIPKVNKVVKHVLINNVVEHKANEVKLVKNVQTQILGSSAPEFKFLSSISGIAGEKDYMKKPKKSFIEDGGLSVVPMSTGYFPRPQKGQTLISFLMSGQFSKTNAELDRENAHFSISEAVISVMEQIKCSKNEQDSDDSVTDLKQRIRLRRNMKHKSIPRQVSPASCSTSTGTFSASVSSDEVDDLEIDEASNLTSDNRFSMSMASLYSEADLFQPPRGAPDGASDILSAEDVALSLISKFNEEQLPRASELEWLVSEEDAPQSLLPLPKSFTEENQCLTTSLRGTREWAPPRPQIIFTLHTITSRKDLIPQQNYRCAGCGIRVAQQYMSKFRYCNYLGRYFCTGCHTNQLAIIPARVIQMWNFKRCIVSNFSYRLLEQMYTDPLFPIFSLNANITKLSRNLQICKKYRQGLMYLKDFILTCRFAETIQDCVKAELPYIINDPEIYSLQDLVNVKSGELKSRLKYIVEMCCRHTSECELCLARGFICEKKCGDMKPIFPWQMRTVTRCSKCGSCYHLKCWKDSEPCSRCMRISKRRDSLAK